MSTEISRPKIDPKVRNPTIGIVALGLGNIFLSQFGVELSYDILFAIATLVVGGAGYFTKDNHRIELENKLEETTDKLLKVEG